MKRGVAAVGGLVVMSLLPGLRPAMAQATPDAQAPQAQGAPSTFRSSVDVVSVSAVVKDRKGRFVPNMGRTDFIVAESGQPRPILDFRAEADGPVKVAVLFDISGSMRVGSKAVDARQAARHILGALRPNDEAAVFSFDTRLDRVTPFTSDQGVLARALDHVEAPFGQTSMYDAVAETARVVASAGSGGGRLPQRSAVIVLTDGIDTRSRLTPEQVAAISSGIDVPVYILAVMSPIDDTRRTAAAKCRGRCQTWPVGRAGSSFPSALPRTQASRRGRLLTNFGINTCSHSRRRRGLDGVRSKCARVIGTWLYAPAPATRSQEQSGKRNVDW